MDYLDFELEIGPGSEREYPVAVIRSEAGEARETMHFPFDKLVLENQLLTLQNAILSGGKRRQILSSRDQAVRSFGRALFDALFTGEVRSRYAVSQREAVAQGKGLRLKLRIQSSELAALPWEFLYDTSQAEYVCLSSNTPILRYLELPSPPQPLTVTLPLSILGIVASPNDQINLDVEREKLRVEEAIEGLQAKSLVKITWLQGHTWQNLQRIMRSGPWHIIHFIGHGGFDPNNDEGLIALEGDKGQSHYLTATQLGRLLTDHSSLRLVVLNSCEGARGSELDIFSSTAAILVRRGIPAVLAMQYEITDEAAIVLSRTFYEALADGWPIDAAVGEARKAISLELENTVEWGTPVLYMRSPDGVLFDLKRGPTIQQIQPTQAANVSSRFSPSPQPFRPSIEEHSEQPADSQESTRDFFISYNSADQPWAEWMAWQLEVKGYTTVLQAWDFLPGSNFVLKMHEAASTATHTIVVLSPNYLGALYTQPEWAAAFVKDPTGREGALLPVRVRECTLTGILASIVYIDLVGLDEPVAREKLLMGVRPGRGKPTSSPAFPVIIRHSSEPPFPGVRSSTGVPSDVSVQISPKTIAHLSQSQQQTAVALSALPAKFPIRISRRAMIVGLPGLIIVGSDPI